MSSTPANSSATASLTAAELAQLERRARRFWVSLVVGLLGLQVAVGGVSLYLSLGDPTVAVVPNYHQKALDWDATHRARQLTQQLGWNIQPVVGVVLPDSGQRLVRIGIRDRQGRVVEGLQLSAKVFHHARGATIYDMHFVETDPGYYEARVGLAAAGLWQIQLQMAGQHGLASEVRDLVVE